MITTIKLPYKSEFGFKNIRRQFSIVVRFSYNRFLENKSEKEITLLCKALKNIELLDSWMIRCAIKEGKQLHSRFKNQKIVFGGKFNQKQYLKNKIDKEIYRNKRLLSFTIQGEKLKKGNRKFKLEIENNKIIFKLNKQNHFELQLPKLRNNIKKKLHKLQYLNDLDGYTYFIRINETHIFISFENFKNEFYNLSDEKSYLGIDMNPENIGISIIKSDKIIYTQEYNLSLITQRFINSNISSDSELSKYFQNKLKFETIEIAKDIEKLCLQHQCKFLFIEKLQFKKSTNKNSKIANRKNKNLWKRNLFINNLKKRCDINNIKLFEVNPAYSSFIGNLMYDYSDPINASIEIGRRGYDMIIKKNKQFYPEFKKESLKHQWKEMVKDENSWKELFQKIKSSKFKYRVSLNDCNKSFRVFSLKSDKSKIRNFIFDFA